jgi:hypothetical protein
MKSALPSRESLFLPVPVGIVAEAAWNVKVLPQRRGGSSDVKALLAHTVSDLHLSPHRVQYVAFAAIMLDTFRYTPVEFLGKKMKQRATHNRYFPVFEALASSVESALAYFGSQFREINSLVGQYVESPVVLPAIA